MKMTSTILLTAVLLFSVIANPLRAQNDGAAANKPKDEPAAVAKDQAVTNEPDGTRPAVRIDQTGLHVGGEEPVDINLPNMGNGSGLFAIVGSLLWGVIAALGWEE
jgi:hypothetical protein